MLTEWQPIETAPKDGTWILLCGGEIRYEWDGLSQPNAVVGQFAPKGEVMAGRWQFAYYDSGFHGQYENPTHWMPLPAPPMEQTNATD
jgi:hypothetical protein